MNSIDNVLQKLLCEGGFNNCYLFRGCLTCDTAVRAGKSSKYQLHKICYDFPILIDKMTYIANIRTHRTYGRMTMLTCGSKELFYETFVEQAQFSWSIINDFESLIIL